MEGRSLSLNITKQRSSIRDRLLEKASVRVDRSCLKATEGRDLDRWRDLDLNWRHQAETSTDKQTQIAVYDDIGG